MQKNPRCAEFYKRTHSPWEGVVSDRGAAAAVPLSSAGTAPGSSREKLLNLIERKQKNFEKAAAAVLAEPHGLKQGSLVGLAGWGVLAQRRQLPFQRPLGASGMFKIFYLNYYLI